MTNWFDGDVFTSGVYIQGYILCKILWQMRRELSKWPQGKNINEDLGKKGEDEEKKEQIASKTGLKA